MKINSLKVFSFNLSRIISTCYTSALPSRAPPLGRGGVQGKGKGSGL